MMQHVAHRHSDEIHQLRTEIVRLRAAIADIADAVEKVAFDMSPPNRHTPIFIGIVGVARRALWPKPKEDVCGGIGCHND